MGKKARRNINFRQSKSDRAASAAYRGFGKYIKLKFNKYLKLSS